MTVDMAPGRHSRRERPIGRVWGAALFGVEAIAVEVQVAPMGGIPRQVMTGQAESEVRESRERVRIALQNSGLWSGYAEPSMVIHLAPAGLRKTGTGLDLPIALSIACMQGTLDSALTEQLMAYGEVGLDGSLRHARGTLSAAITARGLGFQRILVPLDAAPEAALVSGIDVIAASQLSGVGAALRQRASFQHSAATAMNDSSERAVEFSADLDLADVHGQPQARRALEVAAAGAHSMLLIGPPGSGKTMLARRLPTVLPELTREEALEVTQVHSAAGLSPAPGGLVRQRPFRAPHHSISVAGLVGGGSIPRPGEVSLALHGVLFLDELPEFPRAVLETLRQPLEDGHLTVVRASGSARFPAQSLLVAAMNPCPCGWRGSGSRLCLCSPALVDRYFGRISGPLLDRIDLHVTVPAVSAVDLRRTSQGEDSDHVRERVVAARRLQLERNAAHGARWNARLPQRLLAEICILDESARRALEAAMERLELSARAHDRILKVARTIADLAGAREIELPHIAEAVNYRQLDRSQH